MSDTKDFPIKIKLSKAFLEELSDSELGSYEDNEQLVKAGEEPDRPLDAHIHMVARRFKRQLVLENIDEASDCYYAVCTGTAQLIDQDTGHLGFYPACCKVADAIRDTVHKYDKEIGRHYPSGC